MCNKNKDVFVPRSKINDIISSNIEMFVLPITKNKNLSFLKLFQINDSKISFRGAACNPPSRLSIRNGKITYMELLESIERERLWHAHASFRPLTG